MNKEDLKGIGEGIYEAKWKYKMKMIRWILFWFFVFPFLCYGAIIALIVITNPR